MVCFAAFGHAASGHMISAVSLKRMAGEAAFFDQPPWFIRWIERNDCCRDEMIFERARASCYSCEPFSAFMEPSRPTTCIAWPQRHPDFGQSCATAERIAATVSRKRGPGRLAMAIW